MTEKESFHGERTVHLMTVGGLTLDPVTKTPIVISRAENKLIPGRSDSDCSRPRDGDDELEGIKMARR